MYVVNYYALIFYCAAGALKLCKGGFYLHRLILIYRLCMSISRKICDEISRTGLQDKGKVALLTNQLHHSEIRANQWLRKNYALQGTAI